MPKSSTERSRECRERKKELKNKLSICSCDVVSIEPIEDIIEEDETEPINQTEEERQSLKGKGPLCPYIINSPYVVYNYDDCITINAKVFMKYKTDNHKNKYDFKREILDFKELYYSDKNGDTLLKILDKYNCSKLFPYHYPPRIENYLRKNPKIQT
jgi:hypothetical protein